MKALAARDARASKEAGEKSSIDDREQKRWVKDISPDPAEPPEILSPKLIYGGLAFIALLIVFFAIWLQIDIMNTKRVFRDVERSLSTGEISSEVIR